MTVNNGLINLHLKSTISELQLFDITIDIDSKVSQLRTLFDINYMIPGVIINENSECIGVISRKAFFEALSKPYSLELYIKRPIRFLIDSLDSIQTIRLPSVMLIVDAAQKVLERPKEIFDNPILVKNDGKNRVLDVYHLLLAHSEVNKIAMDSLKEANDFKIELLSIVAHDLKNPLYTVKSIADFLLKSDKIANDELQNVFQIYDTTNQMLDHISELLNTTAIQSGKIELKKQLTDLDEIISAIIYQSKAMLEAKNQNITYLPDKSQLYGAEVDPSKIRETFENLISNAIKYSPFDKEIVIGLEKNNGLIRFSVKDQGPGFTDEDKTKIFGKFQRLSARPTAGESSTGLGLYIVNKIIELHNGKIWLESEYGEGSTFFIELESAEIE
ncbi:MAG: HAMP domain-containing sensor histidine kinase [bacterium]